MKAERLLNTLGSVDSQYIAEMFENTETAPRRSVKRVWLIAAIVAAMLALLGCAAYMLSMKDLKLGEGEVIVTEDWISLQGFVGSDNYQAAKEWFEFQQTYDPDGEILQSLSNEETIMPDEYWSYMCYTPEMTAKIDEICERYGLDTLGIPKMGETMDNFYETLQIEGIVHENVEAKVGLDYYFQSGTFMLHGETTLEKESIEYQYRCVMKTDFDGVFLNVGDIESYDQWVYTTTAGTEVLLAIGPDKNLIIVDMDQCFVTIHVPNWIGVDTEQGDQMMNRETMEAFADTFDFSYCPQPISDDRWEALLEEPTPEEKEDELSSIVGTSYDGRVQYLLENASRPEMLDYALMDIDGDGAEELLIARRGRICYILTMEGNTTTDLLWYPVAHHIYHYGWEEEGLYLGPSYMVLCEGNAVACIYEEHKDGGIDRQIWHFAVPMEGGMVWMEEVAMVWNDGDPLYQEFAEEEGTNLGYNNVCNPISEERFWEIVNSYVRVDVEWTPLSEYPLD